MLVLTRKVNETITIGKTVKVKILKIKNNSVQIGIEAPDSINVKREPATSGTDTNTHWGKNDCLPKV